MVRCIRIGLPRGLCVVTGRGGVHSETQRDRRRGNYRLPTEAERDDAAYRPGDRLVVFDFSIGVKG